MQYTPSSSYMVLFSGKTKNIKFWIHSSSVKTRTDLRTTAFTLRYKMLQDTPSQQGFSPPTLSTEKDLKSSESSILRATDLLLKQ